MDMRKLLEAMTKFAGEPEQKPGDQVRGTEKAKTGGKDHPFKGRLVGSAESAEPAGNMLEELGKESKDKSLEWELAEDFAKFNEDNLGVEPKRPSRKGSRPGRDMGKTGEPSKRYVKVSEGVEGDDAGAVVAEVIKLIGEGHTEVSPDVITTKVSAALGRPFMLKDLVAANNASPELQHYISSINPSKIKFSTDILTVKNEDPMKEKQAAQDGVAKMAAKAAGRPRLGESVNEGWGRGNDRVSLPDEPSLYWSGKGPLSDEYNELYEKLVPSQGAADTIEGEVLRAASKIVYRHYNDGDEFNEASFNQLVPYIGRVTSYDDLAHKATEFAIKANGNYHPNPGWDSLDVMEYGPEDDSDDYEEDDYYDYDNPDNWDQEEDDELNEFVETPRGSGNDRPPLSHIVQVVDKLLAAGNTVDSMVLGARGHVEHADLEQDGFTPNGALVMRKWGRKPGTLGVQFIRPFLTRDDANYEILMVSPKHYKIVDKFEDRSDDLEEHWDQEGYDPRGQNPELQPGQKALKGKPVKAKAAGNLAKDALTKAFGGTAKELTKNLTIKKEGWESGPDERAPRERDPDYDYDVRRQEKLDAPYHQPEPEAKGYQVVDLDTKQPVTDKVFANKGEATAYIMQNYGKKWAYRAVNEGSPPENNTVSPLSRVDDLRGRCLELAEQIRAYKESRGHKIISAKLKDIDRKPVSDEEYAQHVERMKASQKEYLKKNPKSIYKKVDEYGASGQPSAVGSAGSAAQKTAIPVATAPGTDPEQAKKVAAATSTLKAATGAQAAPAVLDKAISAATQGTGVGAQDMKVIEPVMDVIGQAAQDPKLANQFKTLAQQAKVAQQQQQK